MSDAELQALAVHAEDLAANAATPPDERQLWAAIAAEISSWLGDEQPGEETLL
jgi:hypothetical protein